MADRPETLGHAGDATAAELVWSQDPLAPLRADLAATSTPAQVIQCIIDGSVRLLQADAAVVALYDKRCRRYRVAAAHGCPPGWPVIGELAPPSIIAADAPAVRLLVLPIDQEDHALVSFLEAAGYRGVLIDVRYREEPLGVVYVTRPASLPFGAFERMLAHGIADQATLALATARVREDLRDADAARCEVMAVISHELRTPLTAIMGFCELLAESVRDRGMADDVAQIERAGRALLEVVENLVTFGKLTTACEPTEVKTVPIQELWARLGEECGALEASPAVALRWKNGLPAAKLRTDATKLTSIVRQLVRNALKFTNHGAVSVEAVVQDRELSIRVTDTGIGVGSGNRAHIFEPFWQVDSSTTRRYGGMGLGLYLVHRFVAQLGGTVAVQSDEGLGSVFTVVLPNAVEGGNTSAPPEPSAVERRHDHHVLLVEDDDDSREALAAVLQAYGFGVHAAIDGEDALGQLAATGEYPCAILLDLMMPRMDGWEFRERQCRDPHLVDIPVALLTASANMRHHARRLAVDASFSKPVDLSGVIAFVEGHCHH